MRNRVGALAFSSTWFLVLTRAPSETFTLAPVGQVVIVSGHLDSWDLDTGALDDGAGVALAMATAHLVQQLHLQPKRTIRVVAWIGEEPGLLRGRAYGREHAAEIANHFAGIETDSGAGHPMGIYVTGDESLTKLLQPVADVLQASGAGILRVTDESPPDLIPLNVRGMPAFSPSSGYAQVFRLSPQRCRHPRQSGSSGVARERRCGVGSHLRPGHHDARVAAQTSSSA